MAARKTRARRTPAPRQPTRRTRKCPDCEMPVRPCMCGYESCSGRLKHVHNGRTDCDRWRVEAIRDAGQAAHDGG